MFLVASERLHVIAVKNLFVSQFPLEVTCGGGVFVCGSND
jgi:hypothetical protein